MTQNLPNDESNSVLKAVAVWCIDRMRPRLQPRRRLEVLERISLAPRHSLALIEAEGRKLLVATSQEGAPAFYALDGPERPASAAGDSDSCGFAGGVRC